MSWLERNPWYLRSEVALTLFGIQPVFQRGTSIVEQEDRHWFRLMDRAMFIGPGRLSAPRFITLTPEQFREAFLGSDRCRHAFDLFEDCAPFDQRWLGAAYQVTVDP
jgi:hypothetical protein